MLENTCQSINQNNTIIRQQQVNRVIHLQMSLLSKIIKEIVRFHVSLVPEDLIFTISTFCFINPLKFKRNVYRNCLSKAIFMERKYLIIPNIQECIDIIHKNDSQLRRKSQRKSVFLTIQKKWSSLQINSNNTQEILLKSKHFLHFLSNLTIKHSIKNINQAENQEKLQDIANYEEKIKQKNQEYTLLTENYENISKSIKDIKAYERHKKINTEIIKTLCTLMNKNIILLSFTQNYASKSTGIEGKYLYFQNSTKISIKSAKQQNVLQKQSIWFEYRNNEWHLKSNKSNELSIYESTKFPYSRKKTKYISEDLDEFVCENSWQIKKC